jgi:hypothetical protein
VWDGFGLQVAGPRTAAAFDLDLPPGRYRVSMRLESCGPALHAAIDLVADGTNLAQASWPAEAMPVTLSGVVPHAGGKLHVEVGTSRGIPTSTDGQGTLWISAIKVEPDPR